MTARVAVRRDRSQRASIGRPSGSRTVGGLARSSRRRPRPRRACPRRRRPSGERTTVSSGAGARPAVGQRARDLDRGQRALERVGRDEDRARAVSASAALTAGPSRSRSSSTSVPSGSNAWFGMTPERLPAERAVHRARRRCRSPCRGCSSQRPSARAASSAAVHQRAGRGPAGGPIGGRGPCRSRRDAASSGCVERMSSVEPTIRPVRVARRRTAVIEPSRDLAEPAAPPGRGVLARSRRRGS